MRRIGKWLTASLGAVALVFTGLVITPVDAQVTILCQGVTNAEVKACDSGYAAAMSTMHWRMYAGHNCTNYIAYQLGVNGVPEPNILMGNARDWIANAKKLGYKVDSIPAVGSAGVWPGKDHIAYVAEVGPGYLITREDNFPGYYPNGMYQTLRVSPGSSSYPAQFIHFDDRTSLATPTGLAVTATTATASSLDWDSVPGAAAYRLQVSTRSDMGQAHNWTFTSSDGTVTGLTPGVTYYFRVAVVDAADTAVLTPYTAAPFPSTVTTFGTPAGLRVVTATANALALAWNAVPGAPKYRIQVSTSSTLSASTSKYYAFDGTAGTIPGLSAGAKYYLRVWVVDAAVTARLSGISSAVTGTTTADQAQSAATKFATPSGLKMTAAGPDTLTLSWAAVAGAPKYRLQISASPAMTASTYYAFDTTTGTLGGLEAGTPYYVRVWVVDAAVKTRLSDISPAVSAMTTLSPGPVASDTDFAVPAGLKVAAAAKDALTMSWAAVHGAPKYRLQVSASPAMTSSKYYAFTGTSGTIVGLKAGTNYYFRVWVVDAAVKTRLSDISTVVSARTLAASGTHFGVPTGLRIDSASAGSVVTSWSAVAGAPKYRLQVSPSAKMTSSKYYAFTGTSGTIPGLKAGTNYYFRVWVVDAAVKTRLSDISGIVRAATTTSGVKYAIPAGLKARSTAKGTLTMSWLAVAGAPKYRVQMSTSAKMTSSKYYAFSGTAGTVAQLRSNTKYYVRIWVVDAPVKARLSEISAVANATTLR